MGVKTNASTKNKPPNPHSHPNSPHTLTLFSIPQPSCTVVKLEDALSKAPQPIIQFSRRGLQDDGVGLGGVCVCVLGGWRDGGVRPLMPTYARTCNFAVL
jgi:hypothetical protein